MVTLLMPEAARPVVHSREILVDGSKPLQSFKAKLNFGLEAPARHGRTSPRLRPKPRQLGAQGMFGNGVGWGQRLISFVVSDAGLRVYMGL